MEARLSCILCEEFFFCLKITKFGIEEAKTKNQQKKKKATEIVNKKITREYPKNRFNPQQIS